MEMGISWIGFALWTLFIGGFGFLVAWMCGRANQKELTRLYNAEQYEVGRLQGLLDKAGVDYEAS